MMFVDLGSGTDMCTHRPADIGVYEHTWEVIYLRTNRVHFLLYLHGIHYLYHYICIHYMQVYVYTCMDKWKKTHLPCPQIGVLQHFVVFLAFIKVTLVGSLEHSDWWTATDSYLILFAYNHIHTNLCLYMYNYTCNVPSHMCPWSASCFKLYFTINWGCKSSVERNSLEPWVV